MTQYVYICTCILYLQYKVPICTIHIYSNYTYTDQCSLCYPVQSL